MIPILRGLRVAGDSGNDPIRYWLVGIVDFCCALLAGERYDKAQVLAGTIWLALGVVFSVIGFNWPRVKSAIRSTFKGRRVKQLETEIVAIKADYQEKMAQRERDYMERDTQRESDWGARTGEREKYWNLRLIEEKKKAVDEASAPLKEELADKHDRLLSCLVEKVHLDRELTELKAPDMSLRGRVFAVAQHLLAYLKEKGCTSEWETAPPPHNLLAQSAWGQVPMEALESHSPAEHAALTRLELPDTDAAQAKMDAIHYGFERKFKTPLQTLYTELRENGIRDYELEQELYGLNPGHLGRFYCSNIRRITERLLVVWSRMEA
jgi:hypothetical protein